MGESKCCHHKFPVGPIVVFELAVIIWVLIGIFFELEEEECSCKKY